MLKSKYLQHRENKYNITFNLKKKKIIRIFNQNNQKIVLSTRLLFYLKRKKNYITANTNICNISGYYKRINNYTNFNRHVFQHRINNNNFLIFSKKTW